MNGNALELSIYVGDGSSSKFLRGGYRVAYLLATDGVTAVLLDSTGRSGKLKISNLDLIAVKYKGIPVPHSVVNGRLRLKRASVDVDCGPWGSFDGSIRLDKQPEVPYSLSQFIGVNEDGCVDEVAF